MVVAVLGCFNLTDASASLDLAIGGYGLSFGNSAQMNGIRFNVMDQHVEQINGFNFSLVSLLHEEQIQRLNGVSLGLMTGIRRFNGVAIGGLQVLDEAHGLALGGLTSGGDMTGVFVNVWGMRPWGHVTGIVLSGIQSNADIDATLTGLIISGLNTLAEEAQGMTISTTNLVGVVNGVAIGVFNASEKMTGVQIGVVNLALGELHGAQIGVVNYAANNPKLLRVLPVINLNLPF
ncbi:MAG: hypothetical protein HY208_00960 [Nitrospirae bacterium]|nr:hypothetical protein [Nitrospirota bacterium]